MVKSPKNELLSTTVPNGTSEIASPIYVELVKKFQMFAEQTAGSYIKLGETLVEADDKLSKSELRRYCKEVGLVHNSSTYKKLMKIGEEASRFEPVLGRTTNNWTTLYKLATLEKDKFDYVANDNRFTPMMTAKQIDIILGKESRGIEQKRDVTIDLSGLDKRVIVEVCRTIKSLKEQFKFHLKFREEIEKLANASVAA